MHFKEEETFDWAENEDNQWRACQILNATCSNLVEERGLEKSRIPARTFNNLGEEIFRLVGCSDVLVPVGIKARAKTQPNP